MEAQLQLIPIDEIQPAPDNVRTSPGDVKELAASIAAVGVLEPVLATKENGHYVLVAGGRRLAAAQLAGLDAVPVIVREFDEQTRVEAMLIENLQRHDLSTLEEANAYRRLVDLGISQRDLAQRIGRSQSHISKRLALLELPEQVAEQVDSGGITLADAGHLTKLKDTPELVLEAINDRPQWRDIKAEVEHLVERKERDEQVAVAAAKAEAEGLRVVAFTDTDGYYPKLPKGVVKISKSGGYDGLAIDPAKHAEKDCHAVAIAPGTLERIPVCTDRKTNHPKAKTQQERDRDRYKSSSPGGGAGTSSEDAEARKREEEELDQAADRRVAFYGTLVKSGKKNDVVDLVFASFVETRCEYGDMDTEIAARALGLVEREKGQPRGGWNDDGKLIAEYAAKGEKELLQAAHALALAGPEFDRFYDTTRWGDEERKHLEFLEQHGYELADIEKKKLGRK